MKTRTFDWSTIPNILVRGKKRTCVARFEISGKEVWRSTRIEADPEGKNADDVRAWLRAFKLEAVKDVDRLLALTRTRDEASKLEDIFAAYRTACKGRDIKAEVVENNITWLELLVRTVKGEFTKVEEVRASIFTPDLLRDFQEARIAAVKAKAEAEKWSPETYEQRMKSAKNTVKSIVQQARSLFAKELLQSRSYRDLTLPNLSAFMSFRVEGSTVSAFERPQAEVWAAVVAAAPELKQQDLARWYAFQLGVNCGLRRGSAKNARWSWIKELTTGDAEMQVRRAKGGHYFITLPKGLWEELKAAKLSTDYIIPRAKDEERDAAIDEVVDWLRAKGVKARCPFHTLRKIFGDTMVREHGLTEGQNALGHSKADLTHSTYAEHRATHSIRVV